MSDDLQFDWAAPEDLPEIEAFQVAAYGADAVQAVPGRTRWMYFEHPLGLHVALCRDRGEIIGVCGHLPQQVQVAGRLLTAGFGVDFMVAAGHRRRGIGRRFLEMRLERFELSLSTGQSPGMAALYTAAGAVDLGPLCSAVFRRRPSLGWPSRGVLRDAAFWLHGLAHGGPRGATPAVRRANRMEQDQDDPWLAWRYGGEVYNDYRSWRGENALAYGREDGGLRIVCRAVGRGRAGLLAALARSGPAAETRVHFAGDELAADLRRAGFRLGTTAARLVAVSRDHDLVGSLLPGGIEITTDASDADLMRHPY